MFQGTPHPAAPTSPSLSRAGSATFGQPGAESVPIATQADFVQLRSDTNALGNQMQTLAAASHTTAAKVDSMSGQFAQLMVNLQPLIAYFTVNSAAAAAATVAASAPTAAPAPTTASGSASAPAKRQLPVAKPVPYSGASKELQPWLDSVQSILLATGYNLDTDSDAVTWCASYLTGNAQTLWQTACKNSSGPNANCFNFHQFAALLKREIADPHPADTARMQMANLKQLTSAFDYTNKFMVLANQIPDRSEADMLWCYKAGLKPEIRTQLAPHNPQTLDEARRLAHDIDTSMFQASSRSRFNNKSYSGTVSSRPSSSTTPMELGNALATALNNLNTNSSRASTSRRSDRRSRSPTPHPRSAARSRSGSPSRATQRNTAFNALTAADRQWCIDNNACFYCRQANAGHSVRNCPVKAKSDKAVRFPSGVKSPKN